MIPWILPQTPATRWEPYHSPGLRPRRGPARPASAIHDGFRVAAVGACHMAAETHERRRTPEKRDVTTGRSRTTQESRPHSLQVPVHKACKYPRFLIASSSRLRNSPQTDQISSSFVTENGQKPKSKYKPVRRVQKILPAAVCLPRRL